MSEKTKIKELIYFCQMVSYAQESKLPLASSLSSAAKSSEMKKPGDWCRQISRRLSEGYDLNEAIKGLSDFDPILAGLLPLLGEDKLITVLETYTRLLIATDIVKTKMQATLLYPLIIVVLIFGNLLVLNYKFFPAIYPMIQEQSRGYPFIIKILYFFNPSLWPWSLIMPCFIIVVIFQISRMMLISGWNNFYNTAIVKLMGYNSYLRNQMKARFQSIIALYLQAGYSVENAVKLAMSSEMKGGVEVNLHRTLHLLENGVAMNLAFEESEVLEYFGTEEVIEIESLPERMLYCSDSNFRISEKNLSLYSDIASYIALILAGVLVLLVTSAFFSSYFFALSGVNL